MPTKLLAPYDTRAGYGGLHVRHGLFTWFAHEVSVPLESRRRFSSPAPS